MRYGLPLKKLLGHCGCSKPYNIHPVISCKKGRFVALRHKEIRDNIAEMLEEVTCEELQGNCSNEARSNTRILNYEGKLHDLSS